MESSFGIVDMLQGSALGRDKILYSSERSGFHSYVIQVFCVLGCDAMSLGKLFLLF
jgi:hypothetical protein